MKTVSTKDLVAELNMMNAEIYEREQAGQDCSELYDCVNDIREELLNRDPDFKLQADVDAEADLAKLFEVA